MSKRIVAGLFASLVLGLILTACAGPPRGVVYVRTPPPPPIVEATAVAPGPDFVWIAGYHTWNGSGYVWVPGRWERRPPSRRLWVPGHWVHNRHGWFWVDGRWR